ncbi:hypothetical protein Tsubulata_001596 [Turnera subulata]|uniref:RING-type E3 ubiquitin transferase n=1 Tax=Turnera subulata TaxID=218843 RepID=A0A9Q0F0J5_9ROSI|nr:hypothetical protein Tsubulata_001596 [Turnera subulata]
MTPQKSSQTPPVPKHGITLVVIRAVFFVSTLPFAAGQTDSSDTGSVQQKFNPSMAIIMVFLVSAFFLMGFFSVYIRQCSERRSRGDPSGPADSVVGGMARRSRRLRGLDETVIETYFPTFLYSSVKNLRLGKSLLECAVCLNEFEDHETLRLIPKCNHVFHPDCIGAWLASHTTCPVCRANLVPKPEDLPIPSVGIPQPGDDQDEPDHRSTHVNDQIPIHVPPDDSDPIREVQGLETQPITAGLSNSTNQNRPPRSRSTGWRLSALFPRSHSTGHSLVQPGYSHERFTLRLPEEVRNQLLNTHLVRAKSCVVFSGVRSSTQGYRSGSGGPGRGKSYSYYERFDHEEQPDRWGFLMTPQFISRAGSVRSQKGTGGGDEVNATPPRSFLRSLKTPLEKLFPGTERDADKAEDVGECSFDKLRPDSKV